MAGKSNAAKLSVVLSLNSTAFGKGITSALGSVNKMVSGVASAGKRMAGMATGIATSMTAMVAGGGAAGGVGFAVKLAADMEKAEAAFTALFKSADKAKAFMTSLADFADKTDFGMAELVPLAQQFLGMGVAAKDVIPMLTAVGDAVSQAGTGEQGLQGVVVALAQIKSMGALGAQEINQIINALPGFAPKETIKKNLGLGDAEFIRLLEGRAIDANTAISALLGGMQKWAGGSMARNAGLTAGKFSTMMDSMKRTASEFGMALIKEFNLKGFMDKVTEMAASIRPMMGDIAKGLKGIVADVVQVATAFGKTLWSAIQSVVSVIQPFAQVIGQGMDRAGAINFVAKGFAMMADAIHGASIAARTLLGMLMKVVAVGAKLIHNVVSTLDNMTFGLPGMRQKMFPDIDKGGAVRGALSEIHAEAKLLGIVLQDTAKQDMLKFPGAGIMKAAEDAKKAFLDFTNDGGIWRKFANGPKLMIDQLKAGFAELSKVDFTKRAREGFDKFKKPIQALMLKIGEERATVGLNTIEGEIAKLSKRGATPAMLADARREAALLRQEEAQQKIFDDALSFAQGARNPLAEGLDRIFGMKDLLAKGFINPTQFGAGAAKGISELRAATLPPGGGFAAAAQRGSAEAIHAVAAFRNKDNRSTNQVLKEAQKQSKYQASIEKKVGEQIIINEIRF